MADAAQGGNRVAYDALGQVVSLAADEFERTLPALGFAGTGSPFSLRRQT